MKRLCCLLMAVALAMFLTACGAPSANEPTAPQIPEDHPNTSAPPSGAPFGSETPAQNAKILVAYFSATGTTEEVAATIAETLNADLFEIVPETPYKEDDLNYNSDCRYRGDALGRSVPVRGQRGPCRG